MESNQIKPLFDLQEIIEKPEVKEKNVTDRSPRGIVCNAEKWTVFDVTNQHK